MCGEAQVVVEPVDGGKAGPCEYMGVYRDGAIHLSAPVDWDNGTPVFVRAAGLSQNGKPVDFGKVIIAGFGLAGRWIAEIFDRHHIDYIIIEQNAETVEAQRKLHRKVVEGDVATEDTLRAAGIAEASVLALTIPNESAVLEATRIARRLKPDLYIVARTMYSSSGMKAARLGADEVIKDEQVVARQFYEMLLRKVGGDACGDGK
jgi:CPA2 family monovalent cation:H+ antiporter-2